MSLLPKREKQLLQFLIHSLPSIQPIKDSQQPQYYHFTRQNQLTLTVLNRDFPSLVLCFKEDLNKFECCTRGGYLVEKFIVKGCDETRHDPWKWQATNISSSSPIERSPLFIFNRNNRINKRNRFTFTCSWWRNYNQDIFCCEKLQLHRPCESYCASKKKSVKRHGFLDKIHSSIIGTSLTVYRETDCTRFCVFFKNMWNQLTWKTSVYFSHPQSLKS